MSKRMKGRQEATSGYSKPVSQYDFILSLGNEDWRLVAYRNARLFVNCYVFSVECSDAPLSSSLLAPCPAHASFLGENSRLDKRCGYNRATSNAISCSSLDVVEDGFPPSKIYAHKGPPGGHSRP
ncbi:hypothetical protein CCUS01_11706 [Colletotrichum cuscutae]|uniref:Uncharacterized protein n=1 Tax=Colletotrichum cuscutae TaxID=1209917 RepID=A0AAI9U223_9PEZI|nr:hypothetical protein CCUS01_11706 [Colletotrichum cuscutae]